MIEAAEADGSLKPGGTVVEATGGNTGLALATSVSAFVNASLLFVVLRRRGVYRPLAGWSKFALTVAAASLLMAVALYICAPLYGVWADAGVFERVFNLTQLILIGAVVYGVSLVAFGFRLRDVAQPATL